MTHIMCDLETLDTATTACVLSIGLVAFDPNSGVINDKFYAAFPRDQQLKVGRTVSDATLTWWMDQSPEAREVFNFPTFNMYKTLGAVIEFFNRNGGDAVKLWGNGPDFDNSILGSLFDSFELTRPWHHYNNRCFRTIKSLSMPAGYTPPPREGTHHDALDDALYQCARLHSVLSTLNLKV